MSGDGIISVRLPRTLLSTFRNWAASQGLSIHRAAIDLIYWMPDLDANELLSLPEPPKESDNPRVSLHVGLDSIDFLADVTSNSGLGTSSAFRRFLHAYLVDRTVEIVQRGRSWVLQLISQETREKTDEDEVGHAAS
jgi:hypothetical protein